MEETFDPAAMTDVYGDDSAAGEKADKSVRRTGSCRPCSWIRKRNHKKKIIRRFLSMNPAYDFSGLIGIRPEPAIWLNSFCVGETEDYDPMLTYNINPYYHIYLSPRGDLRIYHGDISFEHGSYAMGHRNRGAKKKTNKILRRIASDEEMIHSASVYRKMGRIPRDFIW